MPAKERKKSCKEVGPGTKNAPNGIPKETGNLQKIYNNLPWGRLAPTLTTHGGLEEGSPPKFATKSQNKHRSASDSVLPTNTGTSKNGHTFYLNLPEARWRFGAVRLLT